MAVSKMILDHIDDSVYFNEYRTKSGKFIHRQTINGLQNCRIQKN